MGVSRKAVTTAIVLLLIAALAAFLYSTFSAEPWNYFTEYEASALCMTRANGVNPLYLSCMEQFGY